MESAAPFVLDLDSNPHPRMLAEALDARRASLDAFAVLDRVTAAAAPDDPADHLHPLILDALDRRAYWRGFLDAMAAATGCPTGDLVAWLDRHDPPATPVTIR